MQPSWRVLARSRTVELDPPRDAESIEDTARYIGLLPARDDRERCYRHAVGTSGVKWLDGGVYMRRCTLISDHYGDDHCWGPECIPEDRRRKYHDSRKRDRAQSSATLAEMGYVNYSTPYTPLPDAVEDAIDRLYADDPPKIAGGYLTSDEEWVELRDGTGKVVKRVAITRPDPTRTETR